VIVVLPPDGIPVITPVEPAVATPVLLLVQVPPDGDENSKVV